MRWSENLETIPLDGIGWDKKHARLFLGGKMQNAYSFGGKYFMAKRDGVSGAHS